MFGTILPLYSVHFMQREGLAFYSSRRTLDRVPADAPRHLQPAPHDSQPAGPSNSMTGAAARARGTAADRAERQRGRWRANERQARADPSLEAELLEAVECAPLPPLTVSHAVTEGIIIALLCWTALLVLVRTSVGRVFCEARA